MFTGKPTTLNIFCYTAILTCSSIIRLSTFLTHGSFPQFVLFNLISHWLLFHFFGTDFFL
ncbi:uncharacterized protein BYT42DRAFT_581225 [Radiomyces spectabilis]|uniref:uncharacterized protein n=1 Tax=Radiomyces spectabilis TaxID=64574 RepID=UPI00221EDF15|nr:uncharacterized protein BYT42DRAFT_581225 [Radiomyces spectabilis]KAI8371705.1 hypothetical protein BYT42DRAFT_581225 [Radiomyces spectabilis]